MNDSKSNKLTNSIGGAAAIVFAVTVFSKAVGFAESVIVASYFGTSPELDIYNMAWAITNKLIFACFSGISIVGITMFNAAYAEGGEEKSSRFLSALLELLVPVAILLSSAIALLSPLIAKVMTRNYDLTYRSQLTSYIRILCWVAVCYVICMVVTVGLNANKIFIPGAMSGIIQNAALIITIILIGKKYTTYSLVYGVVFGYAVQILFLFLCSKNTIRWQAVSLRGNIDAKRLLAQLFPLFLGEATAEINVLVDQLLASGEGGGNVSALSYSDTLNGFVAAFFIQTITTVLLPFFSRMVSQGDIKGMLMQLRNAVEVLVLVLAPISVITIVEAENLVKIIFERGEFDSNSVAMTAAALTGYAIGFVFQAVYVVSKRPFFACENTRIPMVIGFSCVAVNVASSVLLCQLWGVFGIALGSSVSYFAGACLCNLLIKRKIANTKWKGFGSFCVRVAVASGIVWLANGYILPHMGTGILSFIACTATSFVLYAALLWLLRVKEAQYWANEFYRKLRRIEDKK